MTSHWSRVGLALLFALLISCSGKEKEESADSEQGRPAITAAPVPGEIEALVDLIVKEADSLQRHEFDAAALAKKIGNDPQAHFEWVRDHTSWAPYRGLLRGPQGVMLDGVGSSLDRATLLGALLRNSGHTVRLARGELSEGRAREVLGNVRPMPAERKMSEPESESKRRTFDAKLLPDHETIVEEKMAEAKKLESDALTLARSQADLLYAAVREVASGIQQSDELSRVRALQDHWWIERQDGDRWIAMDVLLPDGKIGSTLTPAASVSAWADGAAMAAIPDNEWHTVRLQVVVERYEDGSTTEAVVLDTTFRAAETITQRIVLGHLPDPWPEALPDAATDPNAIGNTAVNVREWVPYLQVGDEYIVQSGFTEGGQPKTSPLSASRDISDTGGGGLLGGMDMALGGGNIAESQMTAEWLDFVIHSPGVEPKLLRRPVFDVLGPKNRADKAAGFDGSTNERMVERYEALLGATDVMLQPCDFTGGFVAYLALAGIVENQAAFRELSKEVDRKKAGELASSLLDRAAARGPLADLVLWRSTLGSRAGGSFIDRPNVLTYRAGLPVVQSAESFREQIDVASNATSPRRSGDANEFELRLRQGVADTVAEILPLTADLKSAENAATVFAGAGDGPDATVLINARDGEAVTKLDWPADVAARLASDINAGYMALVTSKGMVLDGKTRLAWWRVDPKSGETVGVMDTGFHGSASTEKAAIDDLMEVLAVRLREYAGNRANARWAAQARDYLTRPGVRSLGRADMDRLAMHTRLMRLSRRLTELGYGI